MDVHLDVPIGVNGPWNGPPRQPHSRRLECCLVILGSLSFWAGVGCGIYGLMLAADSSTLVDRVENNGHSAAALPFYRLFYGGMVVFGGAVVGLCIDETSRLGY